HNTPFQDELNPPWRNGSSAGNLRVGDSKFKIQNSRIQKPRPGQSKIGSRNSKIGIRNSGQAVTGTRVLIFPILGGKWIAVGTAGWRRVELGDVVRNRDQARSCALRHPAVSSGTAGSFKPIWSKCRGRPLGLGGQRLPELNLIAIQVIDPGKAAVGFIHSFGVDLDSLLF